MLRSDVVDKNGNSVTEDADAKDDSEEEKDERKVIYYVTDKVQQGQYIKLFKEQGMDAVILDHNIDTSFISQLEQRNEHYKFMRIDADVTDSLKDADDAADLKEETDTLTDLFKKALGNDKLTVKVEKLKNENLASIITLSEEGRRMQDMMKMYAMGGMGGMDPNMFAADQTLTLNANHALVKYIFEHKDSENVPMFCQQLYDLAMLSNQPLSVDAMSNVRGAQQQDHDASCQINQFVFSQTAGWGAKFTAMRVNFAPRPAFSIGKSLLFHIIFTPKTSLTHPVLLY